MKQAPIRIVTTLRTGSCPEGRVIEDRVLKPISPAERKLGVKDELTEWYHTYGSVRPVRRIADRHYERRIRKPRPEPIPHDPPKELQQEIYDEMRGHFALVALDLARSKVIRPSELKDVEHELFRAAIEELPKWDPAKSSRKSFLYEATAMNKYDVIRRLNSTKQKINYKTIAISNAPVADDAASSPSLEIKEVSVEQIPDASPRSIGRLEFLLTFHDFAAMLDPDELLSLDYLLNDYEGTEVAELTGMRYTTWRKKVLESLQMKAECCGFSPHNR